MNSLSKDAIIIELLDEVIQLWSETRSPIMIGSDEYSIRFLKKARLSVDVSAVEIPERIRNFYIEVFLRDVWDD